MKTHSLDCFSISEWNDCNAFKQNLYKKIIFEFIAMHVNKLHCGVS